VFQLEVHCRRLVWRRRGAPPIIDSMSLIERHSAERKIIDGVEREVLVVWAIPNCGDRIPDLIEEAEVLCGDRFYRFELNIPPATTFGA
jgi:hypothetical protein